MPHVAGAGRKWMNHRFANPIVSGGQQYEDHFNIADSFPFSYAWSTDHLTGRWQIDDGIRGSVHFAPANLVNAAETAEFARFDVIFCRNVLIYFDDASRRIAAENLYESLLPGASSVWDTRNP